MSYNILLISPPVTPAVPAPGRSEGKLAKGAFTKNRIGILPPLGLLYLASELLDAGHKVEIMDFNAYGYSQEDLAKKLSDSDIVGLSVFSFNREETDALLSQIKLCNPHIPILVGGPDITLYPRIPENADVSVIGEAESRIVGVIESMLTQRSLEKYKGVLFREDGKTKGNADSILEEDLDKVNFPARHILKEKYRVWGKDLERKVTTIVTTRGCPFRCNFCARSKIVDRYRERSAENVLQEIEIIYSQGYEVLGITDDTFTVNRKRMLQIMDGIIERKIKLILAIEGRTVPADPELYKKFRQAGVRLLYFGIESGNQDVLDFYNKGTTVEQNRYAIELSNKNRIFSVGSFILGAPIETKEHFKRTVQFACKTPLDFANFYLLEYTYGAKLWEDAFAAGKIGEKDFAVPAGSEIGLSKFTQKELEAFCLRGFYRFYIRPKWIIQIMQKLIIERDKRLVKLFFHIIRLAVEQIFDYYLR